MSFLNVKVRGIAAHDQRVSIDTLKGTGAAATDSDYTQANPRPGSAIPGDNRSEGQPEVTAAQTNDLDFITAIGGAPEVNGASLGYKRDSEANTEWRGWNPPNLPGIMHGIEFSSGGTERWTKQDATVIPTTQQVVVVSHDTDSTARVATSAWTWTPQDNSWGSRVTIDSNADGGTYDVLAVSMIPGKDRLVVWMLGGSTPDATAYYSDDFGATWSRYARDWAPDGSSAHGTPVTRLRVAWDLAGNLMMLAVDGATGDWWQWVSIDEGQTFTEHDTGTALIANQTLSELPDGRILLVYEDFSTNQPQSLTLSDAYDEPDATPVEIDTATVDYARGWVDYDGLAFVLTRDATNAEQLQLYRSSDAGTTWNAMPDPVDGVGATNDLTITEVVPSCGEAVCLLYGDAGMGVSHELSLYSLHLGGWSNVEVDTNETIRVLNSRPGFGVHPTASRSGIYTNIIESASAQGWTESGAGTAGHNVRGILYTTSGNTKEATIAVATGSTNRAVSYMVGRVSSGGSQTSTVAGFQVRKANGSDEWQLDIQMDTAGFRVYDVHGATSLGSVTLDNSDKIEFLVSAIGGTNMVVWYKRPSSSTWTQGPSGTLTAKGSAGAANDEITAGCPTSGTATFEWGPVGHSPGSRVLHSLTDSTNEYENLEWGKAVNVYGYPLRDEGDTDRRSRVRWSGGPMRYAETWDVDAIADYGPEKMIPTVNPSPDSPWRSTQTANAEEFVFDLTEAAENTFLDGGFFLVLGLFNVNFRTAIWSRRKTSAGSWTTLGTYDGATGFTSLNYTGDGTEHSTIIPDSSAPTASAGRYLHAEELRGGHAILDTAGTPEAFEIKSHIAGWWRDHTTTPSTIPYLRLSGTPTNASSTCHLVAPSGILVIPQDSLSTGFRYLRLQIPGGQTVPDSYYEIGNIFVGAVSVFGRQWSRGWSWRREPNVRTERTVYGTTHATRLGPNRRTLRVSWSDGVDAGRFRQNEDVDWLGSASVPAIARDDVVGQLWGLQDLARGGEVPVVAVLDTPTSATTITDPTRYLYGRMSGRVQANQVVGDEGIDEVWRVEGLSIEELV